MEMREKCITFIWEGQMVAKLEQHTYGVLDLILIYLYYSLIGIYSHKKREIASFLQRSLSLYKHYTNSLISQQQEMK